MNHTGEKNYALNPNHNSSWQVHRKPCVPVATAVNNTAKLIFLMGCHGCIQMEKCATTVSASTWNIWKLKTRFSKALHACKAVGFNLMSGNANTRCPANHCVLASDKPLEDMGRILVKTFQKRKTIINRIWRNRCWHVLQRSLLNLAFYLASPCLSCLLKSFCTSRGNSLIVFSFS